MSILEIFAYLIAGLIYIFVIAFLIWTIKEIDIKNTIKVKPSFIFPFLIILLTIVGMVMTFIIGLKGFIPGVKAAILFHLNGGNGYIFYDERKFIMDYTEPTIACNMDIHGKIKIDNEILLPTKCSSNKYVIKRELTFNSFPLNKRYNNSSIKITGNLKYQEPNGISYPFIKYSINKSDNCLEDVVWSGTFNDTNRIEFEDNLIGKDQRKYYLFIWIDEEEMEEYKQFDPFIIEPTVSCKPE